MIWIDWLNKNSGTIQAAAAVLTLLITGALTWTTVVISKPATS